MKFALQKSPIPESRIFVAKELKEKHFDATWHAHSEYQLFMVLKGTGTRFIGNTVQSFNEGDLTFLGPGMPHLWRSDSTYFDKRSKLLTHGLVIYFRADFIGDLIEKEEMQQVKDLFEKAKRGIAYYGQTVSRLAAMMTHIIEAHGAASLIQLLQMLETMAQAKNYHLLHNADYIYGLKESETRRINVVYNYAAQHFRSRIALQELADLLSMTPTSFSRYFRMKTSKSFSDFITELRIRHACKLLSEEDGKTINQVSYECGFNTLSNFNRQFRLYMKMTPKGYREQFSVL
ncbi:helix-turn-helix transcriptional regulator [Agriterribacter sp.]|uniref:AraC family transcriptional regulator n=1 Tax=Agriterribacter sp. TaxID=2821509 RepID=UPI002C208882|nr:helix-turn-helix transcriptional regulator [Agriterribacter sp.]HTN06849.1 helix-turn-helix transcriptional regulator [Agriterribacter sp.]